MNTANLQLEGLLLAVAAIVGELKKQGVVDAAGIEAALSGVLREAQAELRNRDELSAANHNAALFPIRFLAAANRAPAGETSFRAVASAIGEREPPSA